MSTGHTLALTLENPFAEALHPKAADLEAYARAWVQRMGLVRTPAELERFEAARYWYLVAGNFPQAPWDVLTIAHDWSCWGFFLDDFDDASAAAAQPQTLHHLFAQVLAILQDTSAAPGAPSPLLGALQDVWKRIHRHSSAAWRRRFVRALVESFSAYQWEARNRFSQRIPAVVEYLDYRRKTSGWRTLALLVDLTLGRTLSERVYSSPAFQQLLDTANNVICWSNDLFSFEKERAIGEVHNLVHIVQTEYRCTIEAAMQMIGTWHNQEVRRWQHLVAQMPRFLLREARHIRAYIAFSEHSMRSNHVWSQVTGRYQPRPT